jgi:hypothetical protein
MVFDGLAGIAGTDNRVKLGNPAGAEVELLPKKLRKENKDLVLARFAMECVDV